MTICLSFGANVTLGRIERTNVTLGPWGDAQ